jgi:hypothetical protein
MSVPKSIDPISPSDGSPSGTGQHTDTHKDFISRLHALAHWVRLGRTEIRTGYLPSLESTNSHADTSVHRAVSRLLEMLIGLIRQNAESTLKNADCRYLRSRIHRILESQGFVVLEQELIGKAVTDVRNCVSINRSYQTTSYPPDQIISVRQPGYLMRGPTGETSVIRSAEVNISN